MKGLWRLGTHDGSFHADEALAVWMMKRLHKDLSVTRSRDPAVLATLDMLVDVGDVYDPARHRFDHHQRGFTETFSERHTTKLSSAGLIFKHFGRDVLQTLDVAPEHLEAVFQRVYTDFVEAMDGIDNGVVNSLGKYKDLTGLSSRVARLNKTWNCKSAFDADSAFAQAVELTGSELVYFVQNATNVWLPARLVVQRALAARTVAEVIVLSEFCPWQDHLDELLAGGGGGVEGRVLYVLWPDGKEYRIRAVPKEPDSFETLRPLRAEWRGLRNEALDAVVGIAGCTFVHAGGFMGGHTTLEGAMEMAKRSIRD
jgi:uncharacterized UPF0160 family protein